MRSETASTTSRRSSTIDALTPRQIVVLQDIYGLRPEQRNDGQQRIYNQIRAYAHTGTPPTHPTAAAFITFANRHGSSADRQLRVDEAEITLQKRTPMLSMDEQLHQLYRTDPYRYRSETQRDADGVTKGEIETFATMGDEVQPDDARAIAFINKLKEKNPDIGSRDTSLPDRHAAIDALKQELSIPVSRPSASLSIRTASTRSGLHSHTSGNQEIPGYAGVTQRHVGVLQQTFNTLIGDRSARQREITAQIDAYVNSGTMPANPFANALVAIGQTAVPSGATPSRPVRAHQIVEARNILPDLDSGGRFQPAPVRLRDIFTTPRSQHLPEQTRTWNEIRRYGRNARLPDDATARRFIDELELNFPGVRDLPADTRIAAMNQLIQLRYGSSIASIPAVHAPSSRIPLLSSDARTRLATIFRLREADLREPGMMTTRNQISRYQILGRDTPGAGVETYLTDPLARAFVSMVEHRFPGAQNNLNIRKGAIELCRMELVGDSGDNPVRRTIDSFKEVNRLFDDTIGEEEMRQRMTAQSAALFGELQTYMEHGTRPPEDSPLRGFIDIIEAGAPGMSATQIGRQLLLRDMASQCIGENMPEANEANLRHALQNMLDDELGDLDDLFNSLGDDPSQDTAVVRAEIAAYIESGQLPPSDSPLAPLRLDAGAGTREGRVQQLMAAMQRVLQNDFGQRDAASARDAFDVQGSFAATTANFGASVLNSALKNAVAVGLSTLIRQELAYGLERLMDGGELSDGARTALGLVAGTVPILLNALGAYMDEKGITPGGETASQYSRISRAVLLLASLGGMAASVATGNMAAAAPAMIAYMMYAGMRDLAQSFLQLNNNAGPGLRNDAVLGAAGAYTGIEMAVGEAMNQSSPSGAGAANPDTGPQGRHGAERGADNMGGETFDDVTFATLDSYVKTGRPVPQLSLELGVSTWAELAEKFTTTSPARAAIAQLSTQAGQMTGDWNAHLSNLFGAALLGLMYVPFNLIGKKTPKQQPEALEMRRMAPRIEIRNVEDDRTDAQPQGLPDESSDDDNVSLTPSRPETHTAEFGLRDRPSSKAPSVRSERLGVRQPGGKKSRTSSAAPSYLSSNSGGNKDRRVSTESRRHQKQTESSKAKVILPPIKPTREATPEAPRLTIESQTERRKSAVIIPTIQLKPGSRTPSITEEPITETPAIPVQAQRERDTQSPEPSDKKDLQNDGPSNEEGEE